MWITSKGKHNLCVTFALGTFVFIFQFVCDLFDFLFALKLIYPNSKKRLRTI